MTACEINPFSVDAMKKFWTKLTRSIAAFRGASAGNVMITFAFATLPVVGIVGFAVDYSHANSVKAAMQAAAKAWDTTVVAYGKKRPEDGKGERPE